MTATPPLTERLILPEGLAASSFPDDWKGPKAHLAPTKSTPMGKALMGKTNSALCTLGAGALLWAAGRLAAVADVRPLNDMAETLLLWERDPRYYHRIGPRHLQEAVPAPREAVETLCAKTTAIFKDSPGKHISDPPVQTIEDLISVTRFLLGPDSLAAFRTWVTTAIATFDRIAANPHQDFRGRFDFGSVAEWEAHKAQNMGPPLPIEACNVGCDLGPEACAALYHDFARSVDPVANIYLAPAEVMAELGFAGAPYGSGAG